VLNNPIQHPAAEVLERYRQRRLSGEELLAVGDHLVACEECSARLLGVRERAGRTAAAVAAVQAELAAAAFEPPHLTDEYMAAYVHGDLDECDREIVEAHLEACSGCAQEARELRGFQALMTTYPAHEHSPAMPPTLWQRFCAFATRPLVRIPLQAAGVTAAAAFAAVLLGVRGTHELQSQNAALREANRSLKTQAAALPELRSQLNREGQRARQAEQASADLRKEVEQLKQVRGGARGAAPALALKDGGGWVDGEGNLYHKRTLPAAVQTAAKNGTLEKPVVLAMVQSREVIARGAPDGGVRFALRAPVGTVVESDRPAFSWEAAPGATGYLVTIYDATSRESIGGATVAGTEWTPPEPLMRGRTYRWEVAALKDGQQVGRAPRSSGPTARFRVLEQEQLEKLNEARATYGDSHLALGVLYTQAGLLDDAEREFGHLLQENPDSAAARRLLASERAMRQQGAPR
jgi:hypothetical protein